MENKQLISIITPAYNEGSIIESSLTEIYQYMESKKSLYDFELIVVNDGSSDETGELAENFAKKHPKTKVFHHIVNLNLGNALKTGFMNAQGVYTIVLDIDLSYNVDHIEKLISTIETTRRT